MKFKNYISQQIIVLQLFVELSRTNKEDKDSQKDHQCI